MSRFDRVDPEFLFTRAMLKWGRWDRDVISLSIADIDFPIADEIKEAVKRAVDDERTPYGDYMGIREFREALCGKLYEKNGIRATPQEVLVIPGTMFGIFLTCYCLLRPGDEAILSPAPVYGPFWQNVHAAGAVPVPHRLVEIENGFLYRTDTLEALVTPKTKLIMICNPHNPTGRMLTRKELEAIGEIILRNDLVAFCDELYEDMIFEGNHVSLASIDKEILPRTITVFGFSKALGMAGYRIAYMVCPEPLMAEMVSRVRHIIVHTDTLAQAAGHAALLHARGWLSEFMAHLRMMRDLSAARLNNIPGIQCHRPEATPFLFPNIEPLRMTSEEFAAYLRDHARVIVEPGTDFGIPGEGYIRINFASCREILEEAFSRMEDAVAKL